MPTRCTHAQPAHFVCLPLYLRMFSCLTCVCATMRGCVRLCASACVCACLSLSLFLSLCGAIQYTAEDVLPIDQAQELSNYFYLGADQPDFASEQKTAGGDVQWVPQAYTGGGQPTTAGLKRCCFQMNFDTSDLPQYLEDHKVCSHHNIIYFIASARSSAACHKLCCSATAADIELHHLQSELPWLGTRSICLQSFLRQWVYTIPLPGFPGAMLSPCLVHCFLFIA